MMIYTVDPNGFYVSQRYENEGYNLKAGETNVPLGAAEFILPKFDTTTNQWVEGKTPEELFEIDKQSKLDELSAKCNQAITAGFQSSALGTAHTYPCDFEAQINFHTQLFKFLFDPTYTTAMFKTLDAGYLPHTKDQLVKAFVDGFDVGFSYIEKLNQLKADVNAVTYTSTTTSTTTTTDFTTAKSQIDSIEW